MVKGAVPFIADILLNGFRGDCKCPGMMHENLERKNAAEGNIGNKEEFTISPQHGKSLGTQNGEKEIENP